MSKVTSKLQLTLPKGIAERYGIRPGDEVEWVPAGEAIRVVPVTVSHPPSQLRSVEERLRLFDKATERQRQREAALPPREPGQKDAERGWKREDLYTRGSPR